VAPPLCTAPAYAQRSRVPCSRVALDLQQGVKGSPYRWGPSARRGPAPRVTQKRVGGHGVGRKLEPQSTQQSPELRCDAQQSNPAEMPSMQGQGAAARAQQAGPQQEHRRQKAVPVLYMLVLVHVSILTSCALAIAPPHRSLALMSSAPAAAGCQPVHQSDHEAWWLEWRVVEPAARPRIAPGSRSRQRRAAVLDHLEPPTPRGAGATMLQNFDFFRKVPRDFTEGTAPGSALSVIATVVMVSLFFLELKSFLTVKIVTDIIMDPGSEDGNDLGINFKMTMPELVCQFASLDVSDMMGTERQGITKDITATRLDSEGKHLGVVDYNEDALKYEELSEDEGAEHACTVTMYEHADFTGWEAVFGPGEYDHARLQAHGAMNDDVESIVVGKGCSAVVSQHGEHDGWEAALKDDGGSNGDGRYDSAALEAAGATVNDVSSLVVHHGDDGAAKEKHATVKEGRAKGMPQRGQIDPLDWSSFDEYIKERSDKMIVVDFYAPWCHWCKLLDPVWKQTAELLPDQPFAAVRVEPTLSPAAAWGWPVCFPASHERRTACAGCAHVEGRLRSQRPALPGAQHPCLPHHPGLHARREHTCGDVLR
jgi:thiol-disulfide isomerase/thioredoxin